MATIPIQFRHRNDLVAAINNKQTTIEPTVDTVTGVKMLAYKDADGVTQKVLNKDGVAPVLVIDAEPIDPAVAPLAHKEGRLYYDTRAKAHTTMNDLPGVRHALGREVFVRAVNGGAVTIPNGAPVYVAGVDPITKTVSIALAKADDYDKSVILAVATVGIQPNASGDITVIGQVNGFDTSALSTGIVYLNTVAGEHTNTRPQYPAKPVITGYVLESHVTTGSMQVAIANDAFDYEFDGTVIEQQDTFVVVDGTAVYAECELLGGGDLPVQLNGQVYLLDCKTGGGVGGRARALLTPGTATTKQFSFVYVELVNEVPTLKTSVIPPTGSFAFVSYVTIWSDLRTTSDGPALHQRSTDAKQHDGRGRIAHIDDKLRRGGTDYGGGVDPTPSIVTQGTALDDVGFVTTPGDIWQAHPQAMPAMDISTDGIFVANASGLGALTVDQKIYNLNEALELTDGTPISGNRFVWVIFGCVNKNTGECKLWLNLPSKVYATDEAAYGDSDGSVSTSVPTSIYSTAFLICKLPARHTTPGGGTIEFVNPVGQTTYVNLRGAPLGISGTSGGGGGGAGVLNELGDVAITAPILASDILKPDGGGLWINGPVDTIQSKGVENRPLDVGEPGATVKNSGKALRFDWLQNLVTYAEDYAQVDWLKINSSIASTTGILSPVVDKLTGAHVAYQGIIADTASDVHKLAQTFTSVIGQTYTLNMRLRAGGKNWVDIAIDTVDRYIDLASGALGSGNCLDADIEAVKIGDDIFVSMQTIATTTTTTFTVYVAESNGDKVYIGDNATTETYVQGVHVVNGSIVNSFPYVKTEAVIESGRHEYQHVETAVVTDGVTATGTGTVADPVVVRSLRSTTLELLPGNDSDATTTFDVDTPENILVTGGANNHTFDLGDATTYAVGKKFNVSNGTSEVMPVENGDKTAWKLLQRLHTLTAELLDNSTAAGVWKITIVEPDKRCLQQFFDDFLQRESFAPVGWRVVNSGGSSVLTGVTGSAVDDNKVGYAKWQSGATANAFSVIQNIPTIFGGDVNNFATYCAVLLKNHNLSVVTNEYFYRIGTGDSAAAAADVDGIFFGYDRATDGDFYTLNTASNSTPTKVVTSIVPVASDHVLFEFVVASDASRVDFWINKVYAGKITTNIPVGVTRRSYAQIGVFKTGASDGSIFPAVDFYEITRVIDRVL